jgi:hypothetical protein
MKPQPRDKINLKLQEPMHLTNDGIISNGDFEKRQPTAHVPAQRSEHPDARRGFVKEQGLSGR